MLGVSQALPERTPEVGELVQVRSRRWLVEEVVEPEMPGQTVLARLACADDDAQGQALDVFWDYEPDRRILAEEGWGDLAARGFDPRRRFGSSLSAWCICGRRRTDGEAGFHGPRPPRRRRYHQDGSNP